MGYHRPFGVVAALLLAVLCGCGRTSLADNLGGGDPTGESPVGGDGPLVDPKVAPTWTLDVRACSTLASSVTRSSNATYFDATGTMLVAAADVGRCDHRVDDGGALGLLIEGTSTNLIPDADIIVPASALLPASWETQIAAEVAADITVQSEPKFGRNSVRFRAENTGTTRRSASVFFAPLQPVTQGESHILSVFGRFTSLDGVLCGGLGFHLYDAGGNYLGEHDSATVASVDLVAVWSRVVITYVIPPGVASIRPRYAMYCLDATEAATVELVAPQWELGPDATSYIPTRGAAATREADTLRFALPNLTTVSGASVIARIGTGVAQGEALLFGLSRTPTNALVGFAVGSSNAIEAVIDTGESRVALAWDVLAPRPGHQLGFAYDGKTTRFSAALDGTLLGHTNQDAAATFDTFASGPPAAGSHIHIEHIDYYDQPLGDPKLVSLVSPASPP